MHFLGLSELRAGKAPERLVLPATFDGGQPRWSLQLICLEDCRAPHPSPAQWLITNQGDFVDHLQALMGQIVGFFIRWSFTWVKSRHRVTPASCSLFTAQSGHPSAH